MKVSLVIFLATLISSFPLYASSSEPYWQQNVEYKINAEINPQQKYLQGTANIVYTNNSPDELNHITLELPQQLYRQLRLKTDNKAVGTNRFIARSEQQELTVDNNQTYYKVTLPSPLKTGQSTKINISWDLQFISREHKYQPRSGFEQFEDGSIFIGASNWYPRVLGYDANHKWDVLPFKGKGEFHPEIANFDVRISAPSNFLLLSSGQQLNTNATLTSKYLIALKQNSFKLVHKEEQSGTLKTWQFKANKIRDFAFALSDHLVWEHKKITTSRGETSLNVWYPNNGRYLWNTLAMKAAEHSVTTMDSLIAPYPFNQLNIINITGISMEYPGFTFVGFRGPDAPDDKRPNYSRTQYHDVMGGIIHEVSHSYFPMLVNTNERREGFLDEGLTSYFSYLIEQAWSEDFQSFYGAPKDVVPVMSRNFSSPMTLADKVRSKLDSHYHIPATAWHILGSQILEQAQLLELINQFIINNQHKRVYFKQLTQFINDNTEIELNEFFNDWFNSYHFVDLSLSSVSYENDKLVLIIENIGGIEAPVDILITTTSGKILRYKVRYQDWLQVKGNKLTVTLESKSAPSKVLLDPKQVSADINTKNNSWLNIASKH